MTTFAQRMEESGGHTTGFDYLRIILAVGVMCWHSAQICYGLDVVPVILRQWYAFSVLLILPMFFALSGFLVAGSLERVKSIKVFLGLRVLRILPALGVEIFLSALFLGPILTTFDLKSYFTGAEFYSYFYNIIGYVHFNLPGLFLDNPTPRIVNNSLWTVPFELECYIALFAIAVFGLVKRPKLFTVLFMIFSVACIASQIIYHPVAVPLVVTGRRLVLFFLAGVVLFIWRQKISHSLALLGGSMIVSVLLIGSSRWIYLAPLPVAYITAYFGLLAPRKLRFMVSGDYSYGIYLYAFPLQQTVALLFPAAHEWYQNVLVTLVPVCLFAAFSWHFVEKPVLRLKRMLVKSDAKSAPSVNVYRIG